MAGPEIHLGEDIQGTAQNPVLSLDDAFDAPQSSRTQVHAQTLTAAFGQPLGQTDAFQPGNLTGPQLLVSEQVGEFPGPVEGPASGGGLASKGRAAVLGFVALIVGAVAYFAMTSGQSPLDGLTALWEQLFPSDKPQIQVHQAESPPPVAATKEAPPAPPAFTKAMVSNPYWALPNELAKGGKPMGNVWSSGHEEIWRQGLNHRFVYQHLKTVKLIRENRLRGSEVLLFDALGDKKFWTRMEAVIALAEFGYKIDTVTVEKALGDARSDLIKNYFMRFRSHHSPGELYVLRQAIRLVDARARQAILAVLMTTDLEIDRLYLAAASFDPSLTVKTWFENEFIASYVRPKAMDRYKALVVDDYLAASQAAAAPVAAKKDAAEEVVVQELKVEERADDKVSAEVEYFQDKIDAEAAAPVEEEELSPDVADQPAPVKKKADDGFNVLGAVVTPADDPAPPAPAAK